MNEPVCMKMHLADTPQRRNASHFGAGVALITYYGIFMQNCESCLHERTGLRENAYAAVTKGKPDSRFRMNRVSLSVV